MRKIICSVLVLLICISTFATTSSQRLFDYDSYEYQLTKTLTASAGVLGPSSATPVTAHELVIALERIDDSRLSEGAQKRYIDLLTSLQDADDGFEMDLSMSLAPQVFLTADQNGDSGIVNNRFDFFLPYAEEEPFFSLSAKFEFGNNFFIETELPLMNEPIKNGMVYTSFDWLISYRDGKWQFFGSQFNPNMLSQIPFLGRGAIGNDWANLIIGRTRHRIGSGYTGNLAVSDNYPYQELLKISATSNVFTYNISFTAFDVQATLEDPEMATRPVFIKSHFGQEQQTRLIHRFDFNIVDKVRLAIGFGATFFSTSSFDFRFFAPFMIVHNYYNNDSSYEIQDPYDEANNIFTLEVEAAIVPGLTLGAQFILDQFQLSFEEAPLPNAFGVLFNLAWTEELEDSSYSIWAEAVYTSAYLYRNNKYNVVDSNKVWNYNYDWILGYYSNVSTLSYVAYSGYPTGPDTIAVALGGNYKNYEKNVEVSANLTYSLIGENGGPNGLIHPTFVDDVDVEDPVLDKKTPSGVIWHSIKLDGSANWGFLDELQLFGGFSLQLHYNYFNDPEKDLFLPQVYIGLKWQPF